MFTPIDPAIKEKVISAYLAGHGRNQITRELHEEWIKVSHGSISNIINAYKRKHGQSSPPPNDDNVGVPMNIGASSPLLNGIGKATSNLNSNTDYVTVKRNEGGPLLCFLPSDMDTTKNVNSNTNSISTSIITDKARYLDMIQQYDEPIDFADTPYPESDVYTDPNVDYDEKYDGIGGEPRFNMNLYPSNPFSTTNRQVSRHVVEETKKEESDQTSDLLGMDWDENHESRFAKWVMDQKTARREEERKLEQYGAYLAQEKNNLQEQRMIIENREKKLAEVADLIPSAQQLKEMGALFSLVEAFIYCVRKKAAAAMIDERTAAWELQEHLRILLHM